MKNKKIIFLVAIVCCLAVGWFCFGAWTIADTSYQVSDFQYSTSTAYLYVVPSSNIPTSEYSNVSIYANWRRITTSNMYSLHNGTFSSMTDTNLGFRYSSSSSYGEGFSVRFYVNVSSLNTSIGNYVITGAYYITSNLTFDNLWKQSNYTTDELSASDFRTIIVFIDKLPSGSGGVSQEEYNELLADYDQAIQDKLVLQEGYVNLRSDYDDLQTMYNNLASQYNTLHSNYDTLNSNYNTLVSDFNNLSNEYDILHAKWEEQVMKWQEEYTERIRLEQEVAHLEEVIASMGSGGSALDFIGTAFEKVGDILQIEILPNITIGTIVAVPLILGVVFLVLRLVRGE